MLELVSLRDGVHCLRGTTNIGVVELGEGEAVIVDTGMHEDYGKRVVRMLAERGLVPKAIMNTHSHADHCGGNALVVKKTGAKVYASGIEGAIIANPYLEPVYLFGGASPVKALRTSFLMAHPSPVDVFLEPGPVVFGETSIEAVALPGHSFGHLGFGVRGVFFCGDAVFSEEVLTRHGIPFFVDIAGELATLRTLESLGYEVYVAGHAEPGAPIRELVEANARCLQEIAARILDLLREPHETSGVVRRISGKRNIEIKTPIQYYLTRAAIQAHLAYLHDLGELEMACEGNGLFWRRKR